VFDGPHATPKTVGEGPVFLGIGALQDGRINLGETRHVTPEDYVKWTRRVEPQPGDVVFSYETRLGQAAIIPEGLKCCLGRRMGLVRIDRSRMLPRFFLYTYIAPHFQEFLRSRTVHGATVDRILLTEFPEFPFPCPSLSEQERITSLLGALDDKIELNRRTNETLEAMARALFKDWFVDFGPTRAKQEGRGPYLAPELWSLFPERLDSEGKPEGWKETQLSELTSKIGSGATPRGGSAVYAQQGVTLVRSQNVYDDGFVWDGLVRIDDAAAQKLIGVTVEDTDVLINITGASILRCCIVDPAVLPARVNQHVAIVRACSGVPPAFVLLHLRDQRTRDYLMGMNAGASREAITKGHIESVPVLAPGRALLGEFHGLVSPLFNRLFANRAESRTLAQTRDLLLPKLMSGEIRVREAEQLAEEVL
jgi:type I restriction enzyme S subunit